jgi:S1-C subfamily serine protease
VRASALATAAQSLVAVAEHGSGFVLAHGDARECSAIVTAEHVIGRARSVDVSVRVGNHFRTYKAAVTRRDRENDLAMLETSERVLAPAVRVATKPPTLYDHAYVLGCPARTPRGGPKQYFGTAVDCRVTGMAHSNGEGTDYSADYQLSIPLGNGMSGGMLLNGAGEVIGVVFAGDDRAFVSFCTSLETLQAFIDERTR